MGEKNFCLDICFLRLCTKLQLTCVNPYFEILFIFLSGSDSDGSIKAKECIIILLLLFLLLYYSEQFLLIVIKSSFLLHSLNESVQMLLYLCGMKALFIICQNNDLFSTLHSKKVCWKGIFLFKTSSGYSRVFSDALKKNLWKNWTITFLSFSCQCLVSLKCWLHCCRRFMEFYDICL